MSFAKQLDFLSRLVARVTDRHRNDPPTPVASTQPEGLQEISRGSSERSEGIPPDLHPQIPAPRSGCRNSASAKPAPTPRGDDEALVARCRELLRGVAADALAAQVRVRWNSRMRSTAGTAYPGKALINLNPRLREFGEEELDRTLRHELAHLLAHHRAGRRRIAPHGREWRRACEDLGLTDERRCHDLPLPRRQMTARHFYRCPSCALVLRRVRPLRTRSACLVCCRAHNGGRYDERFRFTKIRQ